MRLLSILAASALVAVAGCGGSSSNSEPDQMGAQSDSTPQTATPGTPAGAAVQSATVDIRSFKFKPPAIAVKKGGRVKWVNSDEAAHTATADDRSFDTQTIEAGKARMVTFTTTGTFPYHCDFHPFMKGTIVVR